MSDAFAGFKLSDAATVSPVPSSKDQRLFSSPAIEVVSPTPTLPEVIPEPTVKKKEPVVRVNGKVISESKPLSVAADVSVSAPRTTIVSKSPNVPFDTARSERPLSEPETKSVAPFDLNEKPYRKDSFLFTDSEFDRLEDLKLELRRRFDLPATKNDIARCALQVLYEDYVRDAAKSRVVRQLRSKQR